MPQNTGDDEYNIVHPGFFVCQIYAKMGEICNNCFLCQSYFAI